MKKIAIIDNGEAESRRIAALLEEKLAKAGYSPIPAADATAAELIVCVGGDGSFLNALKLLDFPNIPFVGVNTGHLGFFQELGEDDINLFIDNYGRGEFARQEYRTVEGSVEYEGGVLSLHGLNEIVVRGADARLCHLDIYIGKDFIENFSGDGVAVSTSAGSTAYNYALGGAVVDPRLNLLQVTPIAPASNSAYRSFTSGILLPPNLTVGVLPRGESEVSVAVDGAVQTLRGVSRVAINLSEKRVTLLRFKPYSFWNTVKEKLL